MSNDGTSTDTPVESNESNNRESVHPVPLDEFLKVRNQKNELEKKLSKFEEQEDERRKAALSETERLSQERDEARKRIESLENRLLHNERAGLVRSAASKLKFADPEDAVAFVDLSSIEDLTAAERAVNQIAKKKPHLVSGEKAPSGLQAVLKDGLPSSQQANGSTKTRLTEEELRQQEGQILLNKMDEAFGRQ